MKKYGGYYTQGVEDVVQSYNVLGDYYRRGLPFDEIRRINGESEEALREKRRDIANVLEGNGSTRGEDSDVVRGHVGRDRSKTSDNRQVQGKSEEIYGTLFREDIEGLSESAKQSIPKNGKWIIFSFNMWNSDGNIVGYVNGKPFYEALSKAQHDNSIAKD